MRITTASLGLMNTHAPTSLPSAPSAFCASALHTGTCTPSAKPPPAATAVIMNRRRETTLLTVLGAITAPLLKLCCRQRQHSSCLLPDAPPRECVGRCRSDRHWSWPRRCRHPWAWAFSLPEL